ncbi:MAG: TIR domain-containing protein [Planctomycetota bacterium]
MDDSSTFISYSHDSGNLRAAILALAERLIAEGVRTTCDQFVQSPQQGWPKWMRDQIKRADWVLVVCTKQYMAKFDQSEPNGLGVKWESMLAVQEIYNTGGLNNKFVPILSDRSDSQHIIEPLQGATYYAPFASIEPLEWSEEQYLKLYRHLTRQPELVQPPLGERRVLPPLNTVHPKQVGNNPAVPGEESEDNNESLEVDDNLSVGKDSPQGGVATIEGQLDVVLLTDRSFHEMSRDERDRLAKQIAIITEANPREIRIRPNDRDGDT